MKSIRNSDEQSTRLESERALQQVILSIIADNMEIFKQYQDNSSFKKWLSDLVFNLTYNKDGKPYTLPTPKISEHKVVTYDIPKPEMLMVAEEGNYNTKK